MPGAPIQDSSITCIADLKAKLQDVINIHALPVYTAKMTLSKLPDCEIGQPVYIPDHYKLHGKTTVITSISLIGMHQQEIHK
jgi:carbonic anhydrase/acetyltransferase-like protein (isoleucine patch superfamily)